MPDTPVSMTTSRYHTCDGAVHLEGEVYDAPAELVETLEALRMAVRTPPPPPAP